MRFLRLVHSPKLEDAGTHNTFQSLPREVRDLNYDYLLDQPVLQLVSGAKGHEHTHVPCRKAPKTNIRADGEDPALCAQTSDLEPTHAKYRVSTSTSAYLVCRQMMTELRARESWRAHHGTSHRDNLLVHCTEELVGIPAGLLAANPTNLAVLVCLAFPKEIPSDHVASILHELRTYAIKLGIHLERLKDLRIGLQLHNCMLDQAALECAIWNSEIMHTPSPWPTGTSLSLKCYPDASVRKLRGLCRLSLFADDSKLIRTTDKESKGSKDGNAKGYKLYHLVDESWLAGVLHKAARWIGK